MIKKSILLPLPIVNQLKSFTCGAAVIRSLLEYNNDDDDTYSEKEIAKLINANSKFGTREKDIVLFLKRRKYDVFYKQNLELMDIFELLSQKQPIITCIQAWSEKQKVDYSKEEDSGHYVVVVGYDLTQNMIIMMDPVIQGKYGFLPIKDFEQRWHGHHSDKLYHYGLVAIENLQADPIKIDKKDLRLIK